MVHVLTIKLTSNKLEDLIKVEGAIRKNIKLSENETITSRILDFDFEQHPKMTLLEELKGRQT